MIEIEKKTSYQVEHQFPSIYKEDGQELISIVESYYQFLETQTNQSVYNNRRLFEYRDIDNTIEDMLIFFRNKFIPNLPLDQDGIRFTIKHILDLYRRRGTKEGIELFFRMFYLEDVEITYPSEFMLKPSTSKWKISRYIQLFPVENDRVLSDIIGKKIVGSVSKATAFVDELYFVEVNKSRIPIIFLSNVKGSFIGFDSILSNNPYKVYGKIYGSLDKITNINISRGSSNNKVGDSVTIHSETGFGAKGLVSKILNQLSGDVDFQIENGGFGYTLENTNLIISTQTLFFDNTQEEFILEEEIRQTNESNTEISAIVVNQGPEFLAVKLANIAEPFSPGSFYTTQRDSNITSNVSFATIPNDSANAAIGSIEDVENITIIVDLVSDFVNVPLNSNNFSEMPPATAEFSGSSNTNIVNIDTIIGDAFFPLDFTIGKIASLTNIDPGSDYQADVSILAKDTIISKFQLKNQIITIDPTSGTSLFVDDIVVQERDIVDFYGNVSTKIVKGVVTSRIGNNLYVRQLTFNSFVVTEPMFKENLQTPITINSISRDFNSRQMGLNANILGPVTLAEGKISEVAVIDSGFGYQHSSEVIIKNINSNNEIDAVGVADSRGQGRSEGKWDSKESHLNSADGKVLQDSNFYQDYSYELGVSLNRDIFERELKETVHPAGIKMFTKFIKKDTINSKVSISDNIEFL
jgi:hypothetical protein